MNLVKKFPIIKKNHLFALWTQQHQSRSLACAHFWQLADRALRVAKLGQIASSAERTYCLLRAPVNRRQRCAANVERILRVVVYLWRGLLRHLWLGQSHHFLDFIWQIDDFAQSCSELEYEGVIFLFEGDCHCLLESQRDVLLLQLAVREIWGQFELSLLIRSVRCDCWFKY